MALATADIHVKIDPLVKKKAERKLRLAGMTMSDFINLELRRVARDDFIATERVIDEALPENLRIGSEKELIDFLHKREVENNGEKYSSVEMRDVLSKRLGVSV